MTDLHLGTSMDDKSVEVKIPVKTLKRHIAALGASGSGKTVLVKVILEECIRQGIPTIICDIQGDLASLALIADKKTVTDKGVPGSFWEDYKDTAQVAIFTPAATKGIPISMNPLRAPPDNLDPEERIQATDAVAGAVTSIIGFKPGKGKGREIKDYLFLLMEAYWATGAELDDFTELANAIVNDNKYLDASGAQMIDDKLKTRLAKNVRGMTVGADSLIFNLGMPLDIKKLMTWADPGKTPVSILYLNTLRSAQDRKNFIATLANETYSWMLRNPSTKLQLVFLLDELSGLMPPIQNPPTKAGLLLLMKQARKYGVSMLLATQNISDVDYKSLAQVGTWALGRIMTQQDLGKVKNIIEAISPLEADHIISRLPRLKAGQFMLLAPDVYDEVQPMQCRWLLTNHKTLDELAVREIMDNSGLRSRFPSGSILPPRKAREGDVGLASAAASDTLSVDEAVSEEIELIDASPETLHVSVGASDVAGLLDATPSAFSVDEIADDLDMNVDDVEGQLTKLEKEGVLESDEYQGETVYWNGKHEIDPSKNIVGPVFRFHIDVTKGKSKKIVKDCMPKTLGLRATERIIADKTKLVYIPLWRIGVKYQVEISRGFIRKKITRTDRTKLFFVNGMSGSMTVFDPKEKEIEWTQDGLTDVIETDTLPTKMIMDVEVLAGLKRADLIPVFAREEAKDELRMQLGARVNNKLVPAICWYPVWEYQLQDKDTRDVRHVWVDGVYGTYIETSPVE